MTAHGPVDWLVLGVVLLTLVLMLSRPRGIAEAWVALGGAAVILAMRAVPVAAVDHLVGETGGVLLFLVGMMTLTGIVERVGLFDLLAESCARLAGGSGLLLFVYVFLLGALVTATLSLDVTVIMLTPIVYALTTRRRLDAMPFMFACAFVANTASLVFPVSNLTNLLVYDRLNLSFAEFTTVMWLPNVVAAMVNLAIFLLLFRNRLPRTLPEPDTAVAPCLAADRRWRSVAAIMLIGTLAGLFALGLSGRPIWWAAQVGGGGLLLIALLGRRITPRQALRDLSLPLPVFIVSMTIVVDGLERTWLGGLSLDLPYRTLPALVLAVAGGAIGSNMVNNVPMTVLALSFLERAPLGSLPPLAYGTLVGANIGTALTTYGSLATMIWLTLIRRRGLDVSTAAYLKVSLITVPPVLLAASATLWIVLMVLS